MSGPYAATADAYWQAGWRGILPLPYKAKKNPPSGFTGEGGADPSYPDLHTWITGDEGKGNIALRLPRNVIGLDVDSYGDKPGLQTFLEAITKYGDLPATWRTTSRDDGVSGIRLYRVPEGLAWPGELGPATEIIQHKHRYAIVCPSLHPEGRTYRWISPEGVTSTGIPDPDELPNLPAAWVEGLTRGEMASETRRNTWGTAKTGAWLITLPGMQEEPCSRMTKAVVQMRRDLVGSAHNAARDGSLRAIRLASESHPGLVTALTAMQRMFFEDSTSPHRGASGKAQRTNAEAQKEWDDLVTSAANLVTANPSDGPTCDCDGRITASIVGPMTSGSSALAPQADPISTPILDSVPQDATEHTSWWPRDLAAVLSGQHDEPGPSHLTRSDGERLFYAGKVNGLLGESESGKTWVALLAVAQSLAAGECVMYLDFEDTVTGIVGRLRALQVPDSHLTRLVYVSPEEGLSIAARADFTQTITQYTPDLVIVDGFNAAMTLLGLDLDNNKDATHFAQVVLKPLAATGACVVYVDHVPKNKDNRGKGGIGAQAKRAMTTGCALTVDVLAPFGRGMSGRLKLTVDKDRPGHVRAVSEGARHVGVAHLDSDKYTQAVTVTVQPAESTTSQAGGEAMLLMEMVSEHLANDPAKPTKDAIAKALRRRADDVRDAIATLLARGYIDREQVGTGFHYSHVRPFSVAQHLSENAVPDDVNAVPDDVSACGKTPSRAVPTPSGTALHGGPENAVRPSRPLGRDGVGDRAAGLGFDPRTGEVRDGVFDETPDGGPR